VWLVTVLVTVLGIVSAFRMPSGIYPEVEFPRIVVVARAGGAPPDVFLTSVTRPLEQALTQVLGLERIRSKTIRGATEISLQFAPGTDMWRALQMVESRVGEVRSSLPSDADIIVERVTTGSFPVVTFNVSGSVDSRELLELAEFTVRPALASVPGVGRIEVLGGDIREVEVILNPEAVAALRLTPTDVADRLRTGLGLIAVGRVERDQQLVTVLSDAQPRTLEEIEDMPVATSEAGSLVSLRSIAEVVETSEDRTVRIGGPRGETVSISVARMPGASTPDVVERAIAATKALGSAMSSGVSIEPVYDQASLVREAMLSVRDAILVGILLCTAVVALFLRDFRAGVVAALAVPITLVSTFAVMRVAHQTLNLMSLGGMAVAVGLVVDDAIVIIDAILVRRDAGESPSEAAISGTTDLARAVFGTTFTTIVVFLPLAFLEGIVGDFFRALAFTVVTAVTLSLVVALVLVPLGADFLLSARKRSTQPDKPSVYGAVITQFIGRPRIAAIALAVTLGLGVVFARNVERGFLPTMDEGAFVLDYFLPSGTSLETTEKFARRLESALRDTPDVKTFTRRTGAELGPAAATQLSRGDIMVRLLPRAQRARSSDEVIGDLRARLGRDVPEVRIEFVQVLQDVLNDLAGNPRPIEVKLFGPDYAELGKAAEALAAELKGVSGLVDLYDGLEREAPELRFATDRDATARLGVTPDDVSAQLQTALRGIRVGTIRRFDRLIGIRARFPNPVRFDPGQVLALPFVAQGRAVSLGAVTNPVWATSASLRVHEALQPAVIVTADHEHRDLGSVADDVEASVARLQKPAGVRVVLGGQLEGQRSTMRELATVGVFAGLLVLTVLATQFRRLRLAALVLLTIPVAVVGALLSLVLTKTPLNASSLMGCVLLIGLVVKNGVLLLEEAERLVDTGLSSVEAVVRAGARRVRPVLMTTLATLAGLLPLALGIGAGAELQRPLAISVIGGLVTSTLATLVLLPPFAELALRRK
jgi:preprotein translocase subunit SecF